jgi:hypothetical protein
MNQKIEPDDNTPKNPQNRTTNPWFSPRRFRFWAVIAVLFYTLGGFFLAPLLVSKLAIDGVRDSMDRELAIEKVRINPFVLSADLENIELRDTDGEPLFALRHFRANFQLSSLFRWAWTFREIRLDAPYVLYERFAPGDDRFTRLLADMERLDTGPEPPVEEPAGLPRLLVHDLQLNDGTADFRDHVPAKPVIEQAGPVTVEIFELSTLPDKSGRQSVEIRLAEDEAIVWEGSLELAPLVSEGRFTLQNIPLDPVRHYLDSVIELSSFESRLSLRTDYRISIGADDALAIGLTGLETDIEDVFVTAFEPAEPVLEIGAIRTRNGRIAYPEQTVELGDIEVTGLETTLRLDENGEPRILQLLGPALASSDEPVQPSDEAGEPWRIAANEFRLEQAGVGFEDRSVEPVAGLTIAALDVTLSSIDNRDDTIMPLAVAAELEGGGTLGLEGGLTVLPAVSFEGRSTVAGVPLAPAQPYVSGIVAVAIENGALGAEFDLALDPAGDLRAEGSAHVDDLQISDTVENLPLLSWKRLAIDRFRADTAGARVEVSRVGLEEPFGRIQIRADRSTNLSGLAVPETPSAAGDEPPSSAEPVLEAETPAWTAVVGMVDFKNGGMDFSDLSLPLPFAVRIADLNGAVTAIDQSSQEPAGIRLEGAVGDYGLARIDGAIRVFDPLASMDITMEFRNLLMSELSPYSVEFAGREIDEGKLNLDLEYIIENSQLMSSNNIVVSDLVLGAEVESPNAVSLPLDLAVALLRDSNGVIDIDLPIEGDVGDPEFRIGGVIWKAFTSLLTKIVTAPFALLGNLVGGDAEDLGQFEFLAGRADLTPPELEKIASLTEALQQRPQLVIEIPGVYDSDLDAPMLQFFRLRNTVFERLGRELDGSSREIKDDMLAAEYRDVLEGLYRERFPDADLETIRAPHRSAPAGDPEGKPQLDELAYLADLRDRLIASEPVGDADLTGLARARAEAIRDAFLATGGLTEERLRVAEPNAVESEDDEWIVLELAVDAT